MNTAQGQVMRLCMGSMVPIVYRHPCQLLSVSAPQWGRLCINPITVLESAGLDHHPNLRLRLLSFIRKQNFKIESLFYSHEVMFPRKSSVATIDYPIHNLVLPQDFPVTRRRSAVPFSLTRAPTAGTKYATLGTSHHSKTSSSQEPHSSEVEDTGYERDFFLRMGRKLSAFLPKGAPTENQDSPVLRIKVRKEVYVAMEEATRDVGMGSSGNEGPLLHKPPYLWKSPSEERIYGSNIHDSGVSLRPATAPGGSTGRHSGRKPVPLLPMDIDFRMATGIGQSYPEQPRLQTLPTIRPYSAVPDGPMFPKRSQSDLGYKNTPTKQINVFCASSETSTPVPPPVPPRSPKRTQYTPHYQVSASPNTISTVATPIRPAQMRSLGTAWKSLFSRRAGKGKISYNRNEAVLFARKASLKRKKSKAAHSPYQPYSARAVTPSPVHNSRSESPVVSRQISVKTPRRRKRKSGLPSFLSIDSSDSLT